MSMPSKTKIFGASVLCFFTLNACSSKEPIPVPQKREPAAQIEQIPESFKYPHKLFPTAAEALEEILKKTKPLAIGFGEFHQQEATKGTRSSLERFGESLLPVLAGKTSDLVVETWVSAGNCGKQEQAVVKDVDQVTKRPEETEDETVRLLKRASSLGIQPHILTVECDDYEKIQMADGGVDYFELLKLIGKRLGEKARQAIEWRATQAKKLNSVKNKTEPATDGDGGKIVALYGGAIHNDVAPDDQWKDFSFAPGVQEASRGRYAEVDLYVPEFVEDAASMREQDWFPIFERFSSPENALLIELGPKSFIIVFRKGVKNTMETPREENHGD